VKAVIKVLTEFGLCEHLGDFLFQLSVGFFWILRLVS